MRELLLHLCDRALQNHPEDLREQAIGCAVFGRPADYSPAEDNIVRVEIRALRKRLDEYFSTEGKGDPFTIVIPKGSYVPVFEARTAAESPAVAAPPVVALEAPAASRPIPWLWIQGAAILVLTVACVWLYVWGRRADTRAASTEAPLDRGRLWPVLFHSGQQTFVICADSALVVANAAKRRPITLEEYMAGDYMGKAAGYTPEVGALLADLPRWLFTDIADVRVVQRIYRLNASEWDKVAVRTARQTQIQDFKSGNAILLGSSRSNPWNQLFEPALNFKFDYDQQKRVAFIRNKSPQAGEQAEYRSSHPGEPGEFYSVIALVPNLRHNGSVLIVEGTAGESTEATGEFITDPAQSGALLKKLADANHGRVPYFEVLLRSGTLGGVAKAADIVSVRILDGAPGGS
jgi:hypothetical protein